MSQDAQVIVGVEADRFWPRMGEFIALYAALPALLYWIRLPGLLIPGLLAGAAACSIVLFRDPTFDRSRLWGGMRGQTRSIAIFFAMGAAAMLVAMAVFHSHALFELPRRNPILWGAIMFFYPLLSVYPQEIIYRAFLMHRYRDVFPTPATAIAASAAAFAFGHIIFDNQLAVLLTLAGGILFAWRYHCARAVFPAAVEHALYGCLIFTIGLGEFFYLGAVR